VGWVQDALRPVRGQILELVGVSPPLSHVIFGAGGYLVARGDRVLVGSTMEEVGFEGAVTPDARAMLKARGEKLAPGLAGQRITDAWYGFRPATPDGLPAIGPTPIEGLHLAVGFLRNGVLLAPLAAELVVRAALGEPSAIPRPFDAGRLLC
jgi:glycine oxidase